MGLYYIKRLTKQELGLRADGSVARGRYFYLSKLFIDFFPPLSVNIRNDNVLIPIVPPFADEKVYCALVYHNDKWNTEGGTRDEFRLYLNQEIDPEYYFKQNDIVVIERVNTGEVMPIYKTYRFNNEDPLYISLNKLVEDSPARGGHAILDGEILGLASYLVEEDELGVVIPKDVEKIVKQQQEEIVENEIEDIRGASLFNAVSFRDFVMHAYGYKCAVTGSVISYKKLNNLEAAHIQPRAHTGTFLPCNGIALSRDMHWAFDKGMFTINEEYYIIVHEELHNSFLGEYHGKKLNIPFDAYFQPEQKFLRHHRVNVFGLFLYSGMIRSL
ncbi:HNH endonuclease [Sphingobacterium sp. LRF_L2]|uniref:HNH endonuclease n=1 Tax=Sphingobacterium sp. LRF_L2 TaxID=3369421 RepID=UPI003F5DAD9D